MALTAKKVYAILKRQISDMEAKLNSPIRYRGTVATADLLPLNPDIGDMYNIESKSVYGEAGMNVAWNGVVWDTMGAPIDMSLYLTKEEAEAVIQRLVTEYFEKNPVKPGATTEQAQQIEQNKTDIASLKTETNSLKEDISNKITKFYASNQGETHLSDSDNGKIMDMMLYGRSEQKQYSGKNLLPTTMYGNNIVQNGITFTNNGDGSVTASGTATDTTYFTLWGYNQLSDKGILPGLKVGETVSVSDCLLQETNSKELLKITTNGTATINSSTTTMFVGIRINKNSTVNKTYYPQIEKGSEITSYEPYVGGQPSPSPDYPQEIKSVVNPTVKVSNEDGTESQTVALPYTLNAIPVSSGGNVTIDGQQYIADYVDVERGKLVKCVYEIEANGEDKSFVQTGSYCNYSVRKLPSAKIKGSEIAYSLSSFFSEPVMFNNEFGLLYVTKKGYAQTLNDSAKNKTGHIMYALAAPTETDLTPEEIAAFKSLATDYPVTNISVNSEQLDGYTVFNYPVSMQNGWNYVKQQLNDNRDYIYDMDLQSAEAYVNSEYAVALTELEV